MDLIITNYISKLQLGELQSCQNMGIFPLFTSVNESPKYLTLKEAWEKKILSVVEIDQGGSVPELKVINKGKISVLLLDGEELVGAKQNRVLNTTILLKKESETVIPVSCTEQGRWSYVSEEFADSDVVASPLVRRRKVASVSDSLRQSQRFDSDQGAVWEEIDQISASAEVHSPTGAMRDVFQSKEDELDEYMKAFVGQAQQRGLLVFINGKVIGFDLLSLESAYQALHSKLIKSYALDALLQRKKKSEAPSVQAAQTFLQEITSCEEKKYQSLGQGWDYRLQGKTMVGSALVYRSKVIHIAFFRTTEADKAGRMSGYQRRRDFRVY